MTNGSNNDRLDRIEAIVESNSRTIQAMLEQQASDRQFNHTDKTNRPIYESNYI